MRIQARKETIEKQAGRKGTKKPVTARATGYMDNICERC